eukprot:gene2484-1551_t
MSGGGSRITVGVSVWSFRSAGTNGFIVWLSCILAIWMKYKKTKQQRQLVEKNKSNGKRAGILLFGERCNNGVFARILEGTDADVKRNSNRYCYSNSNPNDKYISVDPKFSLIMFCCFLLETRQKEPFQVCGLQAFLYSRHSSKTPLFTAGVELVVRIHSCVEEYSTRIVPLFYVYVDSRPHGFFIWALTILTIQRWPNQQFHAYTNSFRLAFLRSPYPESCTGTASPSSTRRVIHKENKHKRLIANLKIEGLAPVSLQQTLVLLCTRPSKLQPYTKQRFNSSKRKSKWETPSVILTITTPACIFQHFTRNF